MSSLHSQPFVIHLPSGLLAMFHVIFQRFRVTQVALAPRSKATGHLVVSWSYFRGLKDRLFHWDARSLGGHGPERDIRLSASILARMTQLSFTNLMIDSIVRSLACRALVCERTI